MTPLQKIAMGLVIVLIPADFPSNPHPAWAFYDALPDPIGWGLVLAGVWALSASLDLDVVKWLGVVALLLSIPLWLPQVNHLLVPAYNTGISSSFAWAISVPQTLFSLFLARAIGQQAIAQQPRDAFVAGRFGVLTWGFAAMLVLPVVAYGGDVVPLQRPTLILIGLVNVVFIYQLFRVHRRSYLGAPGPLGVHPGSRVRE